MAIFPFGKFNRHLAAYYNAITTSIAFYPILISLFYLGLVIGMLNFDYSTLSAELSQELRWLRFKEMETVRAILTTLIAGIISLMAFSFSMVMVVLNQTTTTVSPKVMQGLVTRKEFQFVLGNQFGSLIYFMILLLLLRGFDFYKIPTFSVSLGLFLGFWSLGLFVYFIHSISHSIQITNVVASLYKTTAQVLGAKRIDASLASVTPQGLPETPFPIITNKPGYLQEINADRLLEIAQKHHLFLRIESELTAYVPTGSVLFRLNVPAENLKPEIIKSIFDCLIFYSYENLQANYQNGFTQLSEVAIKSLSPGINDPGIAVICIQYLSDLFVNLSYHKEALVWKDQGGVARISVNAITFETLFNRVIIPIRHYGKADWLVANALLKLILAVAIADLEKRNYQVLLNMQARAVLAGIKDTLTVPSDATELNCSLLEMNTLKPAYFELPLISLKATGS